jgi:hypothetical protein
MRATMECSVNPQSRQQNMLNAINDNDHKTPQQGQGQKAGKTPGQRSPLGEQNQANEASRKSDRRSFVPQDLPKSGARGDES